MKRTYYAKIRPNGEGNLIEIETIASSMDQMRSIIKGMYGKKTEILNARMV
jgi:hypothetical protein